MSNSEDRRRPLESQAPQNQWLALLNLGWVFVATMVVTVFGGLWLDKRFGTAPLFILLGVFLGFALCGYSFYVTLRKLNGERPAKTPRLKAHAPRLQADLRL